MSNDTVVLPDIYLKAEAAKRPELDAPDHAALASLLALDVEAAGRLVVSTDVNMRAALPRAARILNPNLYVRIASFDWGAILLAIESTCPIMRRFAANEFFNATIGDRSDGTAQAPNFTFPTSLSPDGEVNYVPFVDGATDNVTIESVSKAEAQQTTPNMPDPNQLHALDVVPTGTVINKLAGESVSVVTPDGNTVSHDIDMSDPLAKLPAGSQITKSVDGTKLVIPHSTEPWFNVVGERIHDVIAKAWAWIEKNV